MSNANSDTNYPLLRETSAQTAENESKVYRSHISPDKLVLTTNETVVSVYDLVSASIDSFKDRVCCGGREVVEIINEEKEIEKQVGGETIKTKKTWTYYKLGGYKWLTYLQFQELFTNCGRALKHLGLSSGSKVLMFAPTSYKWSSIAQGCYTQDLTVVTVYDALGEEGLLHALLQCEASVIFASAESLKTILNIADKCKAFLKTVIYTGAIFEKNSVELVENLNKKYGIVCYEFDEMIEIGKKNACEIVKPKADSIACIMYTSGTTGPPKGVLLTHSNLVATVTGLFELIKKIIMPTDVIISFLPLSHIFSLAVDICVLYFGVQNGYASPRTLIDQSVRGCKGDFRELKPTVMIGVPQVYNSIRKAVLGKMSKGSKLLQTVFKTAFKLKKLLMRYQLPTGIIDKIVFSKIKEQTGGRLRISACGGAPLSEEVREFFNVCVCFLTQGYGLTETCGLSVVMTPDIIKPNCAGQITPCNEIKLVDVENTEYSHKNNPKQGELWFRGGSISKGYYKNDEATKEAFTEDGWFKSGDIVQINYDGSLSIIDRKKNLVKLANGEYIALEKLESIYKNSTYINNVCVYADSEKYQPVAIIVPDIEKIQEFSRQNNMEVPGEIGDIISDNYRKEILKELNNEASKNKLKSNEKLADIYICNEDWTPQNGMITSTQKLKRKAIQQKYADQIKSMG